MAATNFKYILIFIRHLSMHSLLRASHFLDSSNILLSGLSPFTLLTSKHLLQLAEWIQMIYSQFLAGAL